MALSWEYRRTFAPYASCALPAKPREREQGRLANTHSAICNLRSLGGGGAGWDGARAK